MKALNPENPPKKPSLALRGDEKSPSPKISLDQAYRECPYCGKKFYVHFLRHLAKCEKKEHRWC